MKPATIGLLTFLLSLGIYTIIGIILVTNSGPYSNTSSNIDTAFSLSVVAAIATAYIAFLFERKTS